jgi:hypothetical protein
VRLSIARRKPTRKVKGSEWITNRRDPLVAGKIIELGIRSEPGQELVASAKIELGITEVEIAVG